MPNNVCDGGFDEKTKEYSKVQAFTRLDAEFLLMDIREIPIKCDHHVAGCSVGEARDG